MKHFSMYGVVGMAVMIAGCAPHSDYDSDRYYNFVGIYDNYNMLFSGRMDRSLIAGADMVKITSEKFNFSCTGFSRRTYAPTFAIGCAGQRGFMPVDCQDGRTMKVYWEATSCTTGHGWGMDNAGRRFRFTFGSDDQETVRRLEILGKKARLKSDISTSN